MGSATSKLREGSHSYGKNGLGSGSADAKNVFDGDGSTDGPQPSVKDKPTKLVLILDEPLQAQDDLTLRDALRTSLCRQPRSLSMVLSPPVIASQSR